MAANKFLNIESCPRPHLVLVLAYLMGCSMLICGESVVTDHFETCLGSASCGIWNDYYV